MLLWTFLGTNNQTRVKVRSSFSAHQNLADVRLQFYFHLYDTFSVSVDVLHNHMMFLELFISVKFKFVTFAVLLVLVALFYYPTKWDLEALAGHISY